MIKNDARTKFAALTVAAVVIGMTAALTGCGKKDDADTATTAPPAKAVTPPAGSSSEGQMATKGQTLPPPPGFKPTN